MKIKKLETARELDARLKDLIRTQRRMDADIAKALLEMKQRGLFRYLGYSRFLDYAAEELDLTPAKAKDLVELAAKLADLPRVRDAFESGDVPWTKARQVARVATVANEEEWLERARTLTSRALVSPIHDARALFEITNATCPKNASSNAFSAARLSGSATAAISRRT